MKPFRSKSSKTTYWRVNIPARFSTDGKRKAKYFQEREDAEQFYRKLKKFGLAAINPEAPIPGSVAAKKADNQNAVIQMALAKLDNDPAQLIQAIEHYEKTCKNLIRRTVREAVEEFQAIKEGTIKRSTWQGYKWRLLKLFDPFENQQMSQITPADLHRWFDQLAQKMKTASVHTTVTTFFGWAKRYNYVAENPMLGNKKRDKYGVRKNIYLPATFERMLRIAAGLEGSKPGQEPTRDFIDLLPWFALSGFCGLRNCEAYRETSTDDSVHWDDIRFDRGWVHIRPEVAKSTRRESDDRYVKTPHYLEAAQSWLNLASPRGQLVVPWTKRKIQDLRREFRLATGIRLLQNGLRSSFASYALTFHGLEGVGRLALEMGNSEAICRKNYVESLEPGTGKAWFGIRPLPENVIPMPAAVA